LSAYTSYARTGVGCGHYGYAATQPYSDEYFYGTTQSLTAGSTYVISFWIRKDQFTVLDYQVGAFISASVPNPFVIDPYSTSSNPTPLVTDLVTSNTYQKVSFCYTPTQNGTHYLTIGSFVQNNLTGNYLNNVIFYIDDVDVSLLPPGSNPQSIISPTNPVFCSTSNVILDGSQSLNSQEYEWKIFEVISGNETLVYDGPRVTGAPSSFNASSSIPGGLLAGSCYKAYLTVYNGCENTTSVDFCVENPQISFLNGNESVCGNTPLNLEVSGDNGWTYSWSSGQTGVGVKTAIVTPAPPTASYSVTATTLLNCTVTESITLNVHDPNNIAPWMDGINGTGEYTIYVNQGEILSFSSTLYNDHSNEEIVNNIIPPSIPNIFFSTSYPIENTGFFNFSLNAGFGSIPDLPQGSYTFIVDTKDLNVCQNKLNQYIFTVNVICENCPICVSYEDRSSTTIPLPAETKAAQCITAGLSETVTTEDENVLFQAGQSIDLGVFFEAGPGFTAQIETTTCITDCEDCCTDWTGFTIDFIDNAFYQGEPYYYINNVGVDDDPTNDFFQITDIDHPFCAYGALGYDLLIENRWGNEVYHTSSMGNSCCQFVSTAPENPIPYPSIYWDGYASNGSTLVDGVYFYYLTLYGCNGETQLYDNFIYYNVTPETYNVTQNTFSADANLINETNKEADIEKNELAQTISLYPNPAKNQITINGYSNSNNITIQLFNEFGAVISRKETLKSNTVDISNLAAGTYYCRIYTENSYILKKFVKL
jgi:hypothetical protein